VLIIKSLHGGGGNLSTGYGPRHIIKQRVVLLLVGNGSILCLNNRGLNGQQDKGEEESNNPRRSHGGGVLIFLFIIYPSVAVGYVILDKSVDGSIFVTSENQLMRSRGSGEKVQPLFIRMTQTDRPRRHF